MNDSVGNNRVVIAGSSGLIGTALVNKLRQQNVTVERLVRSGGQADGHQVGTQPADVHEWDPDHGILDPSILANATAVISLGGASVGKLPWTRSYKRTLWASRIKTTRTIARAIAKLGSDAPDMWLSGSASGFYGSQPGPVLDETSRPGDTFLARLCVAWEAEARRVEGRTRVALLRTSPVIDRDGVLKPMIKLTSLGLGGPLGSGRQNWPWISLQDEVNGIVHVLTERLAGPVNLTGPTLATANDVGRALAKSLHRPFWLPAPEFALRAVLGRDAAESLLTLDTKLRPGVLHQSSFAFAAPDVETAVSAALGGGQH